MQENYKILGIDSNSTDEQVKEAYRNLAKKYHPNNYASTPLADVAAEKMKQINAAFDAIMDQRRSMGGSQNGRSENQQTYGGNGEFADIRKLIEQNRISDAEMLLNGVALSARTAEWYYLKGLVFLSRGWLEDAANHFQSACNLEPGNVEYRSALNRILWQRQGGMGSYPNNPYRTMGAPNTVCGCSACDMCQGLICADCCCECMGGDIVPCC